MCVFTCLCFIICRTAKSTFPSANILVISTVSPRFFPILSGQCELYGDPHYIAFDGTNFDFLKNCTYILVEEKTEKHNFSVIVDNYFCIDDGSCVRAVRVQFGENIVTLRIHSQNLIVVSSSKRDHPR